MPHSDRYGVSLKDYRIYGRRLNFRAAMLLDFTVLYRFKTYWSNKKRHPIFGCLLYYNL